MNTFWLKVAGIVVGIIVVIALVNALLPSGGKPVTEPASEQKTFYDVAKEDKAKYLAKPESVNAAQAPNIPQSKQENKATKPTTLTRPVSPQPEKVTLYFSELSEIDRIEAERLLNVAVPGYSIGRLPMTGYNLAVENCRQIIQRWPDSWYAYRAKQILADIPRRYWARYHITEEEVDVSKFTKPRPGTKPFAVERSR